VPDRFLQITGLIQPVSFTVDDANNVVFIAEKAGTIKVASSLNANTATLAADLSSRVYSEGDLGLTSVAHHGDYLYATYSVLNGTLANTCNSDLGECYAYGRLSRFPIAFSANRTVTIDTLHEEIVVDGRQNGTTRVCAQFQRNGIANVRKGPDGFLYLSLGVGARDDSREGTAPPVADIGQFAGNPCGTGGPWGGAFRAQDLLSYDGKILRVNPNTKESTIIAVGYV
jgi:hypothetical protein